jgi:hypothetical protein
MTNMVTIYHRSGESFEVYPLDARLACQDHPEEYRSEPWTADQRQAHELGQAEKHAAARAARKARDDDQTNGRLVKRA